MTPQLSPLEFTNCAAECIPSGAALALASLAPVDRLGTAGGVAPFIVERAGSRARRPLSCAGGDRTRLSVAADLGESDLHWSVAELEITIRHLSARACFVCQRSDCHKVLAGDLRHGRLCPAEGGALA